MLLDPLVVEHALLTRLIADQQQGEMLPEAHYQQLFPGHEQLVSRLVEDAALANQEPSEDAQQLGMFGSFEPLELLGRGGQGVVYLARDTKLPRMVALKVLAGTGALDEVRQQRFRREAEVAAKLDHPGLCRVLEFGIQDGVPYLAMPHVSGTSLAKVLASGSRGSRGDSAANDEANATPRSRDKTKSSLTTSLAGDTTQSRITTVLTLIGKVAQALHVAHEQGIVHRDIKPGNIMITPAGEPVVLDFGLARDEHTTGHTLTLSSDMMGTPAYRAPEQIGGESQPDRRTDVFALAVVLYECLTGTRPFDAPTRQQMFDKVLRGHFEPASKLVVGLPRDVDQILAVALDVARDRRYETAQAFANDLHRVLRHEPVRARPVGWVVHLQRWIRRNRVLAGSLAAILIVSTTATLLTTSAWIQAESARRDSEAINEFLLRDMLAAANPRGLGREARVVDALQRSVAQVDARLGHSPLLAATVRFEIAKTYAALGLWDESRELAAQALATRRASLGGESPEALAVQLAMASALAAAGEFDAAQTALRQLQPRLAVVHGPDSIESLQCRTMLCFANSNLAADSAKLAESLVILKRCCDLFGPVAEVSRIARSNRMSMLQRANRITEYVQLAERQVQLTTDEFGAGSFLAIESRLAYCNGLRLMGQLHEAAELLPDLIEEAKAALGENHPDYLIAMHSLGACYSTLRRKPEAIATLRVVKDRATAILGSEHRWTLRFANDLALALRRNQQFENALTLTQETLAIKERVFGQASAEVARTLTVQNSIYRGAKDWSHAIAVGERALTIMEGIVGKDDPTLSNYLAQLGLAKQLARDLAGATQLIRRQLDLTMAAYGSSNHWRAKAQMQLGELLYTQGDFAGAEEHLAQCVTFRERETPSNVDRLHQARAWAAMSRYRLGQPHGVIEELETAWTVLDGIGRLKFHMRGTDYFPLLEEIYTLRGDEHKRVRLRDWMTDNGL